MEIIHNKNCDLAIKNSVIRKNCLNFGNFYGYLLLALPSIIFYSIFFALPVLASLVLSFTNFNGLSMNFSFVGLKNFVILFSRDHGFFSGVLNSFIFAAWVTILQNILGLAAALALNEPIKSSNFQRTLLFAPCLISSVVVAFLWSYIYDVNGTINILLQGIGLENLAKPWLGTMTTALGAIIIAHVWRFIGRTSIIYIANLKTIPHEVLEAAVIDGAYGFSKFRYVVFPLLAPATTVNLITAFSSSLNIFDIVYAMTNGGPGNSTETMGTFILKQVFANFNGYASAASIIGVLIILSVNIFVFRFLTAKEEAL